MTFSAGLWEGGGGGGGGGVVRLKVLAIHC